MLTTNDELKITQYIQLIQARGRRLRFQDADLDDAVQEITPRLMNFQFDPDRSNGATERTAFIAVIDNCLLAIHRRHTRYIKRMADAREQHVLDARRTNEPAWSYRESTSIQIDVRTAVSHLSELDQQICNLLSSGHSIPEIAERLGRDWHTIQRHITGIRQQFSASGLSAWLESM